MPPSSSQLVPSWPSLPPWPFWIDAHIHLDSKRLSDPASMLVKEAHAVGVGAFVMAGVSPDNWKRQVEVAKALPHAYPVFGIHPQWVPVLNQASLEDALNSLEDAITGKIGGELGAKPYAIGEIGLDRLSHATREVLPLQMEAFRAQLRLAKRYDLPVVLHLLRAQEDALKILKEEGLPSAGGVVHSYSGAAPFAEALLKMGLFISFSGALARPQSRRLRESAALVPLERLMVETDSPDQSPPPYQREANRPMHLPLVGKALAEVKGISPHELRDLTFRNTRDFFRLPL